MKTKTKNQKPNQKPKNEEWIDECIHKYPKLVDEYTDHNTLNMQNIRQEELFQKEWI